MRAVEVKPRPAALVCSLLLLLGYAAVSRPARAGEIAVEDYVLMTQSLLELSVAEWEERAEVAAAHKGDRKALTAKLEAVAGRHKPRREEVYSRFGLSPGEDLRYATDHRAEIESYLEEHPDARDTLASLKGRIDALIEKVESAAPPQGVQR